MIHIVLLQTCFLFAGLPLLPDFGVAGWAAAASFSSSPLLSSFFAFLFADATGERFCAEGPGDGAGEVSGVVSERQEKLMKHPLAD